MKRVVVAGAAGFVGANLVHHFLRLGHEVHALVRRPCNLWRLSDVCSDVMVHWVDLEDGEEVGSVLASVRADWILNLAAHGAYPSQGDLRKMVATNIVGTINLVEAAASVGFEAFLHTGSSSEYGTKDHPATEDEWLDPNSYYAVTKASATHYCRFVARRDALPIRIIRPYSIFGPWEEPSRLMPRLVARGLAGHLPPLADPDTAHDFVYVDDVIEAYLAAAGTAGQEPGVVYNVGTGVQTTLRTVVEVARRELDIDEEPQWSSMTGRSWDAHKWVADRTRIGTALGWRPGTHLDDGFRRFVAWMREDDRMHRLYSLSEQVPS